MELVNTVLSEKTSIIVNDLLSSLKHPVLFLTVDKRPNQQDKVFGAVDVFPKDGLYKIWLDNTLAQDGFEANLLHELRHIFQIESGFPLVCNKNHDEFFTDDRPFFQEVGAHLQSVILDIEVNSWLISNHYSYDYFFERNFKEAIRVSSVNYNRLDDPLNFANMFCALLSVAYYADEEHCNNLYAAYARYPKVIEMVKKAKEKLGETCVRDPYSATLMLGYILDELDLWRYYYIVGPSFKIRTRGEYTSFLSEM